MNGFLRLVISLFGGLTAALFAIKGIGATQPDSTFALLFTNPDGSPCSQPCLFGIRPGVTTYDEAVRLLKAHPLTRQYPHYLQAQNNPDGSVMRQVELAGSGTW